MDNDQVRFIPVMQGWFNIKPILFFQIKLINVIYHIIRVRYKNHIVFKVRQYLTHFHKTLIKVRIEGYTLNPQEHLKHIVNITLTGKRLKFSLKFNNKIRMFTLSTSILYCIQYWLYWSVYRTLRQGKERKDWGGKVKLSLNL